MLNPYRVAPAEIDERVGPSRSDDRVLGVLMLVLGGLRVGLAVAMDEVWGAEVTIAALMTALGLVLSLVPSRGR
jgi:hypothetical protein